MGYLYSGCYESLLVLSNVASKPPEGADPTPFNLYESFAVDHQDDATANDTEFAFPSFRQVLKPNLNTRYEFLDRLSLSDPKRIEDLIHLAELCIEVLQQNEEHYLEVCFSFIY